MRKSGQEGSNYDNIMGGGGKKKKFVDLQILFPGARP